MKCGDMSRQIAMFKCGDHIVYLTDGATWFYSFKGEFVDSDFSIDKLMSRNNLDALPFQTQE